MLLKKSTAGLLLCVASLIFASALNTFAPAIANSSSCAALDAPLSLHTATRRQGRIRGAGDKTLRDASSRATKAFYPALSLCDLIFSGVFERHPRLTLAIVEFELAWVPHVLSTMDYTYRERHGEAIYRFKDAMRPSDFFHRNVVLSFQEDAVGVRLRDVIGVDNMMWGSDYPHSESTFPQSRKILADILAGVPACRSEGAGLDPLAVEARSRLSRWWPVLG